MDEKIKEFVKPAAAAGVEIKTMVADFNKITTMQEYQDVIGDKLKDMNICMLFLNAGYA